TVSNIAYWIPLMVCKVYAWGEPPQLSALSVPVGPWVGSRVWSPLAPVPTVVTKVNVPAFQFMLRIVELFRPSTQTSSCLYEIIDTRCACADATIASSLAFGAGLSL